MAKPRHNMSPASEIALKSVPRRGAVEHNGNKHMAGFPWRGLVNQKRKEITDHANPEGNGPQRAKERGRCSTCDVSQRHEMVGQAYTSRNQCNQPPKANIPVRNTSLPTQAENATHEPQMPTATHQGREGLGFLP